MNSNFPHASFIREIQDLLRKMLAQASLYFFQSVVNALRGTERMSMIYHWRAFEEWERSHFDLQCTEGYIQNYKYKTNRFTEDRDGWREEKAITESKIQ